MNFTVHYKPDSREICFVPDNDYTRFLTDNYPELGKHAVILDTAGNKLGEHEELYNYTIKQCRGLAVSALNPLYVVELDSEKNAVIVDKDKKVYFTGLITDEINYIATPCLTEKTEDQFKSGTTALHLKQS